MIPNPTPDDQARDAETEYRNITEHYSDPRLMPRYTSTSGVLAWIRLAEFYRKKAEVAQ